MPTLQIDDSRKLTESLIICEYLDTAFPGNKIIPSDPYEYAIHKLIVRGSYTQMRLFYKLAKRLDTGVGPAINEELVSFTRENLRGQEFLGGDRPLYADFMVI